MSEAKKLDMDQGVAQCAFGYIGSGNVITNNSSRCTTVNEQGDAFFCSPFSHSLVLFISWILVANGFQNLREAQRMNWHKIQNWPES